MSARRAWAVRGDSPRLGMAHAEAKAEWVSVVTVGVKGI